MAVRSPSRPPRVPARCQRHPSQFRGKRTITVGTARATFDATTNTLNVTVANTGVTTGATIANAINNDTTFTATAGPGAALGYTAGSDRRTDGSTTINTNDGGSLVVSSLITAAPIAKGENRGKPHDPRGRSLGPFSAAC